MPFTIILAGGGTHPLVRDIGFCILVAGILSVVFTRLRIPALAAFLAAGILLGPVGFEVVSDRGNIETIAGLGLVLLLFLIGLEIDLRKLLKSGKVLLLAGTLQFPLCVGFGWALTLAARAAGWEALAGTYVPLYVGFTLAASSTLLVVKLLQERGQMDTVTGRVAVGILIFQDMWAIVVLALQPNFEAPEVGPVAWTFTGILLLAALAALAARFLLPHAFRWIARAPELMLVAATAWCFGIGFLGNGLGGLLAFVGIDAPVSVSLEMGALIAGASLASLPFATEVVSKVGVVHDFFITLFFVALGMQIPAPEDVTVLLVAGFLVIGAVAARGVVFFPLLYGGGMDRRNAVVSSTRLAQISEFCLVIAYLGMVQGHLGQGFVSSVIFAFVITALASPLLFGIGDRLHEGAAGLLGLLGFRPPPAHSGEEPGEEPAEVAVLGVHRVASSLLHEVARTHPALCGRILVVDFNVAHHDDLRARGFRVRYGDISNPSTLHHAGVGEAGVILCTIPDDLLKGTSNLELVKTLREMAHGSRIVVNALTIEGARDLYAAGADYVCLPRVDAALAILPVLLAARAGELAAARAEQERLHGPLAERREVMP